MSRILIAEDNQVDQLLLSYILKKSDKGYDVRVVNSGQGALDEYQKNEIDLVLIDVELPDIKGLEVFKKLQEQNTKKFVPVIFVTAYPQFPVQVKGLRMGAVDYLVKPVHHGEFKAKVEGALRVKKLMEDQQWSSEKTHKAIRRLYKDLEDKNDELKKLDQLKSEFIATVSHELRTPLGIIRESISQVIDGLMGEITEKQKRVLTFSLNNVVRLTKIINDLLDMEKLGSKNPELEKELINIVGLLQEIVESFSATAQKRGLSIQGTYETDECNVFIDKDKIIQVLTNLINNALKFTENGRIDIVLKDKEDEIECAVVDTGIGMAKDDLSKVFDKFQQFGRKSGPGEKGTGLGLAICKSIIELHGGCIKVESELNQGSTFVFTLPKS